MEFVQIPAGTFLMGDSTHQGFVEDYEGPAVEKEVHAFEMAKTPVTNAEFLEFVQATGYQTLAERLGDSYVFHLLLPEEKRENYPHVTGSPWWKVVPNANWAHPFGEGSSIEGIEDHPVVHIALEDAIAYCRWAKVQLPTEVQWEYAARAMSTSTYPWGEDLVPESGYRANTWQGDFPNVNDALDGFVGTAPVYSFEPNDFGLYQMIGNVWEWCYDTTGEIENGKLYTYKTFEPYNIYRRIKGGSGAYSAKSSLITNRSETIATYSYKNFGFCIVRTINF